MPPLTMQEEGLTLPYVMCLLSYSRMCLGRHCRGHPVHVSQLGGCPHMCPWVGPHAPSFGRQLWGLPSRVEYLSPQGVLPPHVYGTTASPLWLELRGRSAVQATPSWTVYRLACHRLLPWLRVTFAMVPVAQTKHPRHPPSHHYHRPTRTKHPRHPPSHHYHRPTRTRHPHHPPSRHQHRPRPKRTQDSKKARRSNTPSATTTQAT